MADIIETLATLDNAPAMAARVRLRVTGRGRGAAPVVGPSGRALTTCSYPVPLSDADRADLEAWAAEAAGATWPEAEARVRLDLEDGSGATVAGWSRTWQPAQLTGRAATPGGASARPPWVHPPAQASALEVGAAQFGGAEPLVALLAGVLKLNETITMASLNGYQRLASEAVAQNGQTARTQAAQLGGVTSTVAKTAADAALDRREAEAERAAALTIAGEHQSLAAALQAKLDALEDTPKQDGTPAGPPLSREDRILEKGMQLLGGALAGGVVRLERQAPGEPTAPGVAVLPSSGLAPAPAPASAPAPAVVESSGLADAVAEARAVQSGWTMQQLLDRAAGGDADARAQVRAALGAVGGLAAVAWLGEDG